MVGRHARSDRYLHAPLLTCTIDCQPSCCGEFLSEQKSVAKRVGLDLSSSLQASDLEVVGSSNTARVRSSVSTLPTHDPARDRHGWKSKNDLAEWDGGAVFKDQRDTHLISRSCWRVTARRARGTAIFVMPAPPSCILANTTTVPWPHAPWPRRAFPLLILT